MAFIKRFTIIIACLFFTSMACASNRFVVRNIKVVGLQRISTGTVISALPVHIGQTFNPATSTAVIKTLYGTGYFDNVTLQRRGDTLIVKVHEKPTIALITIKGIKAIPMKKLKPVLKRMGITEGSVYDSSQVNAIVQGLEQEYAVLGHYSAKVNVQAVPEPRNTVALHIYANEGPVAIVRRIRIVGNHAFSQHELLKSFKLETPNLINWITKKDRYSKTQLAKDLQSLQEFYMNHGYLRMKVLSQKVKVSPDSKSVYITIHISEGPIYYISGFSLHGAGKDTAKVRKFIVLNKGEKFSRAKILSIDKRIANYYANKGFAYPDIHVVPRVNDSHHGVFIAFTINKGKRIYVRQIHIAGNNHTEDFVLRTQMRQLEGGVFSTSQIKESKRNLQNLPYITNIHMTPVPVPGHPNQVDLNYHVKEVAAGRASVQGGYSDVDGFLYGASISEPNFMGSGKAVSIGFQNSKAQQNYSVQYMNPFYTINGVSRSMSVYYTHTTPGKINLESYTTNDFGGTLTYGVPLTEFSSYTAGIGFDHISIGSLDPTVVSPSVVNFSNAYPGPYNQVNLIAGISRATLDRAIFPNSGSNMSLSFTLGAPVFHSSLGYYKTTFNATVYWPLGAGFVIQPHMLVGYGDGIGKVNQLPFFNDFYGGGIGTLPGFEPNTLGPKNPRDLETSQGGNFEMFGGLNIIFPNFISQRIRTSLVLNAGNIWDTHHVVSPPGTPQTVYDSISFKNMRSSVGLMISWWWPLGAPINLVIARATNSYSRDQTTMFGFNFGTSL